MLDLNLKGTKRQQRSWSFWFLYKRGSAIILLVFHSHPVRTNGPPFVGSHPNIHKDYQSNNWYIKATRHLEMK